MPSRKTNPPIIQPYPNPTNAIPIRHLIFSTPVLKGRPVILPSADTIPTFLSTIHRLFVRPHQTGNMIATQPSPSISPREILRAWAKILGGQSPMLSIEITRECPLTGPGCYAYGDSHLTGGTLLRELIDF